MNYYEPNPCYDSNYSSFDQFEPLQVPVIHQPIREKTCAELLAKERAANINTQPMQYSVKVKRFFFYESKGVSLAWETISEIEHAFEDKQYQPEGILELFRKLHDDVQNIHEETIPAANSTRFYQPRRAHWTLHNGGCASPLLFAMESDEVRMLCVEVLVRIPNDVLREKLLNVNLLIAKIEALKDNPTQSSDFVTKFFCEVEPISGNFTMDVVEDIFDNPTREPRVHVPNVLPTHLTLQLDLDFTLSNKFSISFIHYPPFPMIDTLLPFSLKNKDKVVNSGILGADKEKSPHPSSHRGLRAFNESTMMISGEDTPNLDDFPDYEDSRARGFVLRSLELQILSFIMGI
ncbi:hypothetical protein Tco_1430266 [Tanacetum coccineum]